MRPLRKYASLPPNKHARSALAQGQKMNKAKVAIISLAAALAACAGTANAAQRTQAAPGRNVPMVQDWSTQRAYFSRPELPQEARAQNRYQRWERLAKDPRYMFALNR